MKKHRATIVEEEIELECGVDKRLAQVVVPGMRMDRSVKDTKIVRVVETVTGKHKDRFESEKKKIQLVAVVIEHKENVLRETFAFSPCAARVDPLAVQMVD